MIVCAGHTAANYEQLRDGFAAGIRGVTHLFNAMTPMNSREPGAVGAALENADAWCGLIVDGYHVHDATLRVAIAARPRGKMMLVTDAMPPVGGEREDFELYGVTMTCRDGQCTTADGTLAGSALDMAGAVRNTRAAPRSAAGGGLPHGLDLPGASSLAWAANWGGSPRASVPTWSSST